MGRTLLRGPKMGLPDVLTNYFWASVAARQGREQVPRLVQLRHSPGVVLDPIFFDRASDDLKGREGASPGDAACSKNHPKTTPAFDLGHHVVACFRFRALPTASPRYEKTRSFLRVWGGAERRT